MANSEWKAEASRPPFFVLGRCAIGNSRRVLPFDERAGLIWARLMAEGTAKGRPRSALDVIIATIAEANGCIVVTDNGKDFTGLKFINPIRTGGAD